LTRIALTVALDPNFVWEEPPSDVGVTAANLLDNTRVQIYNVTTDSELDNAVVSGGSGYSGSIRVGSGAAAQASVGDTIRLRATYENGLTYSEPLEVLTAASTSGISFVNSQTDWTILNGFNINGSAVTEFTADYPNIEVDITDSDNQTTKQRLIAWYAAELTTEDGIRNFFGAIDVQDESNYEIKVSVVDLHLSNTKTAPLLFTDDARLFRDDGTTVIDSVSNSIQLDAGKVFSTGIKDDLASVKAKTDQITFTNSGEIDSNIISINSVAVEGTGQNSDKWR
jgi:hypothetical protein